MKSSEVEILVVAGHEGSGEAHWQQRLIAKLSSAKLVEQDDWHYGSLAKAVARLVESVAQATKPVIFVAHSAGCVLVAHAVPELISAGVIEKVKGAYLVSAPAAGPLGACQGIDPIFTAIPMRRLPFPALLVASSNDPFATPAEQAALAEAWGAELVDAGAQGHINTASGHGPWPEGMMRFAGFLSKLK